MLLKLGEKALGILDKLVPDKEKQGEFITGLVERELDKTADSDKNQTELNKTYAEKPSFYMAGARPTLLWILILALASMFIVVAAAAYGAMFMDTTLLIEAIIKLQPFYSEVLYPLIFGLLGLSTIRTVEKRLGIDRKKL